MNADSCQHYFRELLDGAVATAAYDQIEASFEASMRTGRDYAVTITISAHGKSTEDQITRWIHAGIKAFYDDHPEVFWLSNEYQIRFQKNCIVASIASRYTPSQIQRINRLLRLRISKLTRDLPSIPYLQILIVYRRLVRMLSWWDGESVPEAHSIIGPVLFGKAVCSGYTAFFLLALRRLRIPCHCIHGGGHEWAGAYLDGMLYHFDPTWEARIGEAAVTFSYFCRSTDDFIRLGHTIDVPLPPSGTGMSYYEVTNRSYTEAEIPFTLLSSELNSRGHIQFHIHSDPCVIDNVVKKIIRHALPGQYTMIVREDTGAISRKKEMS